MLCYWRGRAAALAQEQTRAKAHMEDDALQRNKLYWLLLGETLGHLKVGGAEFLRPLQHGVSLVGTINQGGLFPKNMPCHPNSARSSS